MSRYGCAPVYTDMAQTVKMADYGRLMFMRWLFFSLDFSFGIQHTSKPKD
jgi:hypothetical protein